MTIKEYIEIKGLYEQYENHPKREEVVINDMLAMMPKMKLKDAQKRLLSFMETLTNKNNSLIARFEFKGTEYGLMPNMDNMTTEEFLFIQKYSGDVNSIHKLMAVLFRPITSTYGKYYDIKEFNPDKMNYSDMLEVDVKIYLGVQAFFLTLYQQSLILTIKSGQKTMKKNLNNQEKE